MRINNFFAIIASGVLMIACGGNGDNKESGVASSQNEQQNITKKNKTTAIKWISAERGGVIVFQDGVKLVIPQNALASDTEISITKNEDNSLFILKPEGLQNENPLTLQVPVTSELVGNPKKIMSVYTFEDDSEKQVRMRNLVTAFTSNLQENQTVNVKFNRFSVMKKTVQDPVNLSYFLPEKYLTSVDGLMFVSGLNLYEVTTEINEITETIGNSIQFRVNPIYLLGDATGSLSGTNLQYGYGLYSHYGELGITPPSDFDFSIANLPADASFDKDTGIFTWNNISEAYANTSHNVTFNLKSSYPTSTGGTEIASVAKTLTIVIKKPSTPRNSTLSGAVKEAISQSPLLDVQVKLFSNGEFLQEVQTNTAGEYQFEKLEAKSGYSLSFLISGYLTENYDGIETQANAIKYLETVLQVDTQYSGLGRISGAISSALDGRGVSGLTINFRQGINARNGEVIKSTTTEANGFYRLSDLQAGNYTGEIVASGYQTSYFRVVVLGGREKDNQNGTVNPILAGGETRIVLTWGNSPYDLDSHLTGPIPNSAERFHIYYFASGSITTTPYSNLDVDDTNRFGPETVTIRQQFSGIYRYSIHDYSNKAKTSSRALANSSAKIQVYQGAGLVAEYPVPNQEGTLWTVFEIEGNKITPINRIDYGTKAPRAKHLTTNKTDASLIRRIKEK